MTYAFLEADFSPADVNSYYQARVANVFVQPLLDRLIAETDPDIAADVQLIAEAFLKPVQDPNAFSFEQMQDAQTLYKIYEIEEENRRQRHDIFDEIIQKYIDQPDQMRRLAENVARIGYVIKSTATHSHENVMDDLRAVRDRGVDQKAVDGSQATEPGQAIPDGLEHFIMEMVRGGYIEDKEGFYAALAQPEVVSVSTAHPTRYLTTDFTNMGLKFVLCARQLTRRTKQDRHILDSFLNGEGEAYEALKKLWSAPLTFTDAQGGPADMTPLQEIRAGINDVEDDFTRTIDEIYRTYDDTLDRLQAAHLLPWDHHVDDRQHLKLSLRFATWITGDKDGNKNLRSEHLMLAALLFQQKGASLYAQQLQQLAKKGVVLGGAPDGGDWHKYMLQKKEQLASIAEPLLQIIPKTHGAIDLPLSRHQFTQVLKEMQDVYTDIDVANKSFQEALVAKLGITKGDDHKQVLSLLRKSRTFGFGLMKFHLRETADEYTAVVDNLLRDNKDVIASSKRYADMSDDKKLIALNAAMAQEVEAPGTLAALKEKFFDRFPEDEAGNPLAGDKSLLNMREYTGNDPDVITAHTLQRFEVGTTQKNLITDHVLAECKGALQMLETLFICKICGIKPIIVPLLEEQKTLTQAIPIFIEAFEQRAFRDYMWELAQGDITQIINLLKVQYAHSDNMRRMGLAAARANIYDQANLLLPGAKEKLFPHILKLYVQDGRIKKEDIPEILRRMNEKPNAYCIRQFHGGSRCDTARGGIRPTSAFAKDVNCQEWTEGTDQGADNTELRLGERFKRLLTTLIVRNALDLLKKSTGQIRSWNYTRGRKLCSAIDRSIEENYHKNHYGLQNQLGIAMGEFGYDLNRVINNPGSRGERSAGGGVNLPKLNLDPVQPKAMRTIGFTSTGLDMGLGFAILPMRNMTQYINELYAGDKALRDELQQAAVKKFGQNVITFENGALTQEGLQTLNKISPIYRAVSDFAAYGAAISDPQLTLDLLQKREERKGPAPSRDSLDYFSNSIPQDYVGAAVPYLQQKGFKIPEDFISAEELKNPTAETCRKLGFLVRKITMPHIDEQLGLGERVHHFGRILREAIVNKVYQKPENDRVFNSGQAYLWRLTGIMRSIFGHVLYDGVADNAIGKLQAERRTKEEWRPALAGLTR